MGEKFKDLNDFEMVSSFYSASEEFLEVILRDHNGLIGSSLADALNEVQDYAASHPAHEVIESLTALQDLDVRASMMLKDLISLKISKLRGNAVSVREELIKIIQYGLIPMIREKTGGMSIENLEGERSKKEIEVLTGRARELIKQMSSQVMAVEQIRNATAEIISRADVDVKNLIGRVDSLDSIADEKLSLLDRMISDAKLNAIQKEEQVNKILGHLSGRAISGDFEKNASDERGMANNLRYASIFCMGLVVLIAGYSFIETTKEGFEWSSQVSRFLLMLLITVPAAYLARESGHHRAQHYSYLQKSLDLKTITPFLASLPEDEQHRIKAQIAGKLFVSGDAPVFTNENFPINIHELLVELIKRTEKK